MTRTLVVFVASVLFQPVLAAQVFDEKFEDWPVHTSIGGTIVLAPDLDDVSVLKDSLTRIDDASIGLLIVGDTANEEAKALAEVFQSASLALESYSKVSVAVDTLRKWMETCDVICIRSANTVKPGFAAAVVGLAAPLRQFVRDGKRLVLVGGIANLAGKLHLTAENTSMVGLNVLPDAILVGETFSIDKLTQTLANQHGTVGLIIRPNTALVVGRRIARVIGGGSAQFVLPPGKHHDARMQTLRKPERGQRAPEFLVDWTEWRRDSLDRGLPQFPPLMPTKPHVDSGALLIVGGGGMPKGLMDRFVELAGGTENAKLVYVPCSEQDSVSPRQGMVAAWKRMGVKSATFIHTKDRTKANSDEEFLAPLKDATGIWFGGGRQWNMADSYYGTKAHQLMKEVLRKGGVIGGSSAGASIQARYLARATPIENFRIMAPGYERGGLGFISGVAIDQHFSQRGRQKDMTQLVSRYPQMLGIGLDEATAIEVKKSVAKVTGKGRVFFYDRNQPVIKGERDYVSLPSGSSYDLSQRTVLVDASEKEDGSDVLSTEGSSD